MKTAISLAMITGETCLTTQNVPLIVLQPATYEKIKFILCICHQRSKGQEGQGILFMLLFMSFSRIRISQNLWYVVKNAQQTNIMKKKSLFWVKPQNDWTNRFILVSERNRNDHFKTSLIWTLCQIHFLSKRMHLFDIILFVII